MTLSVSYIVKNEEKNIRKSLESIKDIADEIIIVDTGSTDKTMDICREYGKVFEFQWCNDFAKAKNYALNRCTMDYVLSLDADETVFDVQGLIELMLQGKEAYMLNQYTIINKMKVPCKTTRLIKNGLGFRFDFPIHETLDSSVIQNGYVLTDTDYFFEHHGYQVLDVKKNQMVLDILQTCNHPLKNYYSGLSYYNLGNMEKAYEYFSMATEEPLSNSIKAFVWVVLGKLYLETCIKGIGTVLTYLSNAIKLVPNQYAGYLIASEAYEATGDKRQAIETLEKILERNKIGVSGMHQDTIVDINIIKDKINSLKEEI